MPILIRGGPEGSAPYSQAELESTIERRFSAPSEDAQDAVFAAISENTSDPSWSRLIFHTDEFARADGSIDNPAAVPRILEHKAILW
jgi:hypothetical protein